MLERIIKYFVYATKGHITKTQLTKFLYLADLYAVKWTGKQLTDLDWRYYYGPWHERIEATLERMNGKEIVQEVQGNTIFLHRGPILENLESLDLPLSLELMLDNIRREWSGSGQDKLYQLQEYINSTAPLLEVKDSYQPTEKVKLNLFKEREKLMRELG